MTVIFLFLAGFAAETLVSWQTKALQGNRMAQTVLLCVAAWLLWGFVLPDFVLSRWNAIPFALGAGLGAAVVVKGHQ